MWRKSVKITKRSHVDSSSWTYFTNSHLVLQVS